MLCLYFRQPSHVIMPFYSFSSKDYPGKICDQQEILQNWLLALPTTLLEDVVEKVFYYSIFTKY